MPLVSKVIVHGNQKESTILNNGRKNNKIQQKGVFGEFL